MAHIQKGDERQYFSNELSGNEVSEGIREVTESLSGTINNAQTIVEKANESKLANYQIDLASKWMAKNNEINTKYQTDPTNPDREKELAESFENLASQYKVNPLVQGQWSGIKNNVYNSYKEYNTKWQLQQQQTNATNDLKNGYESLINQVSMMAMNGANIEQIRLIYRNGIDGLKKGGTAVLGNETIGQFLKDSDHDFMSTIVSGYAYNSPLYAQKLMKDKGVLNDIGNAETIEKLNDYVNQSLTNKNKRIAVQEFGNALRAMNSKDANNIIEGRANMNQVTKFIETNKKLPEGSKDLILGIYGIGSKTEYYYDRDKMKITKNSEGGSGGSGGSRHRGSRIPIAKMSSLDKQLCAETLEQELHNLISFNDEGAYNVKNVKKNKTQSKASTGLIGYMKRIAGMQGAIDASYKAKVIDSKTRNRMMNSYLQPVSNFLESKLSQLDEGSWWGFGQKLGYGRISKAFSTEGLKGDKLRTVQRQKLFAQNYYLDELNKVVAKVPSLKSIYDIESLPSRQQQEIYKTASDNALLRAKRWTDKPEYFFAKEYPTIYSQPFVFFNKKEAGDINRKVAEAVFKREFEDVNGKSTLSLKDFANDKMRDEINNQAKINRIKAGEILNLRPVEPSISRPEPKNINEFYQRVKALGVTPEQFMRDAKARGLFKVPVTIDFSTPERINNQVATGYYYALREMEQAKALQDAKRRKR